MNFIKIKKKVFNFFLPLISYFSKIKYQQQLKILIKKKELKIALHFIIEKWDNTSEFSLESFFQTSFEKFKLKIYIYFYENNRIAIEKAIQNFNKKSISFELISIAEGCQLFEQALKNAINLKAFDMHDFCHAEAVFNRKWLEKSIALGTKLAQTKAPKKIAVFSTFNPNDNKLFYTVYQNEDYIIKNGFSFLNVFFYNIFLQNFVIKISNENISKYLIDYFKTYEFFAAFTHESFIEGINNESFIEAEKTYPKPNNLSFAQNPSIKNWQTTPEELKSFTFLKLRTLVIQINYGGLGDHLFCSHLPRIAKETGRYDKVYVSNHSKFRQEEIKDIIWKANPFIDGFCDLPGFNIEFLNFEDNINILDKIMLLHNIDDGKRFHEPEIFFKPALKPELRDKIIFDPNYISDAGDKIDSYSVEKYFRNNNITIDYQMQKRDKSITVDNIAGCLQSESLKDYIDIIASCKELFCFASGAATLSAALGKKAYVFYYKDFNRNFLHSKLNTYIEL